MDVNKQFQASAILTPYKESRYTMGLHARSVDGT